jgi:hypothetical protein
MVLEHAGVVLQRLLGDHHVADRQLRVEPAGDAGEHHRLRPEALDEQRRRHRRVDLADAREHQHHLPARRDRRDRIAARRQTPSRGA